MPQVVTFVLSFLIASNIGVFAQFAIPSCAASCFNNATSASQCTIDDFHCICADQVHNRSKGAQSLGNTVNCFQHTCGLFDTALAIYAIGGICLQVLGSISKTVSGGSDGSSGTGIPFLAARSAESPPATTFTTVPLNTGSGLTAGSIAAIVFGVLLGLFLIAAGCCFWCCSYPFRKRKKSRRRRHRPTTFAERNGQIRPTERVYDDREQLTVGEMVENPIPTQPGQARMPGRTPELPGDAVRLAVPAHPGDPTPMPGIPTSRRGPLDDGGVPPSAPPRGPRPSGPSGTGTGMRHASSRPSRGDFLAPAAGAAAGYAAGHAARRRTDPSPTMTGARQDPRFDIADDESVTTITLSSAASGTPLRSSTESQIHTGLAPRVVPRTRSRASGRSIYEQPPPVPPVVVVQQPQVPEEYSRDRSRSRSRRRSRRRRKPSSSSSSSEEPQKKSNKARNFGLLGAIGATAAGLAANKIRQARSHIRDDDSRTDLESRRPRSRERRSSSQDTARPPARVESVSSSHSSGFYEEDDDGQLVRVPHVPLEVESSHMGVDSVISDSTLAPSDSGSQQGTSTRRAPPPSRKAESKRASRRRDEGGSESSEGTVTSSVLRKARLIHLEKARARRQDSEPIDEEDESGMYDEEEEDEAASETGALESEVFESSENGSDTEVEDLEAQGGSKRVRFTNKRRPGKG